MNPELPKQPGVAIRVAFETNGKGHLGFLVELPGAFVRGGTEEEAIAKADREAGSYLKWLGLEAEKAYEFEIVERKRTSACVEDADTAILLEADKGRMDDEEFTRFVHLVRHSGETFLKLYTASRFKDWVDRARIRKTFYGENPRTIERTFDHVKWCQNYYLSRINLPYDEKEQDFMRIRRLSLERLEEAHRKDAGSSLYEADGEPWTLRKVLRRFLWHDRIHAKAMTRILEKQRRLGLINDYADPYFFEVQARAR